jgi:hypothetical protein
LNLVNDLRKRVKSQLDLSTADPSWVEVYETACAVGEPAVETKLIAQGS